MANALKYKQTKVPKQPGEMARLKVVQGPDMGVVFVLTGGKVSLGRGEENDVMFMDLKSSRKHAEMEQDFSGDWSVKDLGSANGIVHNGNVTREAQLKKGDTIAIGETVFEFVPETAGTKTILAPGKSVAADYAFPVVTAEPSKRISKHVRPPAGLAGISAAPKAASGMQNKRLLVIAAVGLAAYLYLDDAEKPKVPTKKPSADASRDLASYLPAYDPSERLSSAEMFFRAGFREYREKNYLRAKTQFETTLQIAPGHRLATLYLKHSERAISDEVKLHLARGRKGIVAGKLKSAKGHFESVLRLLYRNTEDPEFSEAQDQLKKVEEQMKGGSRG